MMKGRESFCCRDAIFDIFLHFDNSGVLVFSNGFSLTHFWWRTHPYTPCYSPTTTKAVSNGFPTGARPGRAQNRSKTPETAMLENAALGGSVGNEPNRVLYRARVCVDVWHCFSKWVMHVLFAHVVHMFLLVSFFCLLHVAEMAPFLLTHCMTRNPSHPHARTPQTSLFGSRAFATCLFRHTHLKSSVFRRSDTI